MLKLIDVKKDYQSADFTVQALRGIDVRFRANEFVSILGPSGCGKTTLLNIIGGLDHYTSGDLVINGVSTKNYTDRDWDVYRNHRIGFVFQSYNLIPHQTVLGNVEIALTIAGVSKTERRKRAVEALEKVGLGKEIHKRPNQLSGGQMQRVAIARALVNNPEILLADEPTGALDSVTSVQIMELIREIAGERLVIMVTHNPELAEQYSSRIVRLQDGLIVSDSNPYTDEDASKACMDKAPQEQEKPVKKVKKEKASMSFLTSLGLSGRNLRAKKGRTTMTSVAGSIGVISVCLVLALSNGFKAYIQKTEEDMLSYYPIEISETTFDMTAVMTSMMDMDDIPDLSQLDNKVYVNSFLTNVAQDMAVTNDISKEYLDYLNAMDENLYTAIAYSTGMDISNNLFTTVDLEEGNRAMSLSSLKTYYTQKLTEQEEKYAKLAPMVEFLGSIYGKMPGTADLTDEKYGDYVLSQYEIINDGGYFPRNYNEAVLVVGGNNDVTDLTLAQLGLIDEDEFMSLFPEEGETVNESALETIAFSDLISKTYVLNYNDAIYTEAASNATYMFDYEGKRETLDSSNAEKGIEIKITGVLRLKEGLNYGCLSSGLYFTEKLINEYQAKNLDSQIALAIKEQADNQTTALEQMQTLAEQLAALDRTSPDYMTQMQTIAMQMQALYPVFRPAAVTVENYYVSVPDYNNVKILYGDTALRAVGGKADPNQIKIYTDTFDKKEGLLNYLDDWNDTHDKSKQIRYTDTVGLMMSMVETMLDAITYVLVAFTAISLVVSSVMIGIITYVSVVERTKEIGVLRSLGARKKDIRNLFNAETFLIGLFSGSFGVGFTYLLCVPINLILGALTGISTLASLPLLSAGIMVSVSIILTLISGLIPANAAAKKDPVIALRTE